MAFVTIPPWIPPAPKPGDANGPQSSLAEIQSSVPNSDTSIPILYGKFQAGWLPAVADYNSGTSTWTILGIVGWGEIEAIDAIWINGAAAVGGVSSNSYTGTTSQGVDSLMSGANASWDQTLVYQDQDGNLTGIAYIVLQYTNTHYSGLPTVIVEGRGRKVYDPRTATTAYSATAALCLGDLISNPTFGLGAPVDDASLGLVADDNETGFVPAPGLSPAMRKLNTALKNRRGTAEWLDVLRLYASCWINKRGDTYFFRSDSNTTADVTIDGSDQWGGRLPEIGRADEEETPTQVEVVYTDDTPDIWVTTSYVYPEELDQGTPRILSRLDMPGIIGFENAAREAMKHYNQLQTQSRIVVWYGMADQMEREQGDAVIYDHPLLHKQLFLRVSEPPTQIEPGLYRVPCVELDNDDYGASVVALTAPATSSQPRFIGS